MLQDKSPKGSVFGQIGKLRQCFPTINQIARDRFAYTFGLFAIITLTIPYIPVVDAIPRAQPVDRFIGALGFLLCAGMP